MPTKTNRPIAAIIVALMLFASWLRAEASSKQPSLLVTIGIEGLNEEYLDLLAGSFVGDGFKHLRNSGLSIYNVDFGKEADAVSATAILHTGADPAINGVTSAYIFNRDTRRAMPALFDPSTIGNFTNETLSAAGIKVSTLSDELKIDSDGESAIHSISIESQPSIIASGHAGNSAVWFNQNTGNWASTTYYGSLPDAISHRNYRTPLSTRIDTMTWVPLLPPDSYPGLSIAKKVGGFRVFFPRKDSDRYLKFAETALANREVTDLAIQYITDLMLGRHQTLDMLNITYRLIPYAHSAGGSNKQMIYDSYLRLDRDLSRLIKTIGKSCGDRAVIVVVGLPTETASPAENAKWRIPQGQFSVRKAQSLLNMYLMAKYGNGDWVVGFHNQHFFLNHKTIADAGADLGAVKTDAADFLMRMAGVNEASTITKSDGDIKVQINPGWEIVDTDRKASNTVVRYNHNPLPAYIVAPGLNRHRISETIDARRLAPTIARIVNLRAPNGASEPPIAH